MAASCASHRSFAIEAIEAILSLKKLNATSAAG